MLLVVDRRCQWVATEKVVASTIRVGACRSEPQPSNVAVAPHTSPRFRRRKKERATDSR